MIKIVALDRDGIINVDSPSYVKSLEEWKYIPGSIRAVVKLKQYGYTVIVVTNQAGIARGFFTMKTLNTIHYHMVRDIRMQGGDIDAVFCCYHLPEDCCDCRKPEPGLILQASMKFNIFPREILVMGDSITDMLAAENCGSRAFFIKTTIRKRDDLLVAKKKKIPIFDSITQAVDRICI